MYNSLPTFYDGKWHSISNAKQTQSPAAILAYFHFRDWISKKVANILDLSPEIEMPPAKIECIFPFCFESLCFSDGSKISSNIDLMS